MSTPIQITTTVLPGGKIEITSPELRAGQIATVTITIQPADTTPQRHALDILEELPGHLIFQTAEEVDAYIREERDSWDRS